MTKENQKIAHIERITIGGCTCRSCNVFDSDGNNKEYPTLHCDITCKKNETVKQDCSCFESNKCPEGSKGFRSDHSLSLEKLIAHKKGDSKGKKAIQSCIDGEDGLKYIYISFDKRVKNGTLTAELHVTKDFNEKEQQPDIEVLDEIYFPIDIFKNQTNIKIDTGEINQNPANITNKDLKTNHLLSQYYDEKTENFCRQIGEDPIENGIVLTALGSLLIFSALFIGFGLLYKKYRNKTTETNPEDSNNVI